MYARMHMHLHAFKCLYTNACTHIHVFTCICRHAFIHLHPDMKITQIKARDPLPLKDNLSWVSNGSVGPPRSETRLF